MTSTSASLMASAIASQPLMSCSVSTSWCSRSLTWTAIRPPPRARPLASPRAPLPADSLLAAKPFVARSFVTSGGRGRIRRWIRVARAFLSRGGRTDLRVGRDAALCLEPLVVAVVVLLPELPFVLVVLEPELVDHHDAVRHRTDLRADAAADARLVHDFVVALGRDLGALVLRLFLDERHDVVQAHPVGRDLGERAEHAVIGVVVLEDPEAGERGPSRNGDQRVWALGLVGLCQDLVGAVVARDQKEAVL